jgi:hypothetical protein
VKKKSGSGRSAFLVVCLALCVLSAGFIPAYASSGSGPAASQSQQGIDVEVIDVTTPSGKLMSESARNKILKDWYSWGYTLVQIVKQQNGHYVAILKRTAASRGLKAAPSSGAGFASPFHYEGRCMVMNYTGIPAPSQAWNCDCWRLHRAYMTRTYGAAAEAKCKKG